MGTTTTRSSDPRTPVQTRGNILVLFVVLALAGAAAYGYFYAKASKDAGPQAALPMTAQPETTRPAESPTTAATPVTRQ